MTNGTPPPWSERVLGLCPALIAILWVAGVAHFRDFELEPVEWAVVVAAGFALQVLVRRTARPRPLPKLPPDTRPAPLAAIAALFLAILAGAVGGLVEWLVQDDFRSEVPWSLRTLWHAACAFGAGYCSFLRRVLRATRG